MVKQKQLLGYIIKNMEYKGLKLKEFGNVIYIENGIDSFYCELKNNKYILFHQNKRYNNQCYHIHKNSKFKNLKEVLDYCHSHKKMMFKRKSLRALIKIENLLKTI